MDYCLPCRRHLNGALACPGCGTPIEQLRVYAHDSYEYKDEDKGESPYDGYDDEADRGDESGDGDGSDGGDEDEDEPLGRAARRREQGRGRSRGGAA
ncbi:hypothetical protein ACFW2E_45585, partial [Streptomyces sp. NPDC058964]